MATEETTKAHCDTCANRGRVNGSSQETYCEQCIFQSSWRVDHYVPVPRSVESALPAELRNAAQFKHYELVIPGVTGIGSKFTHQGEAMTVVGMTPNWIWATFDKWDKEQPQ